MSTDLHHPLPPADAAPKNSLLGTIALITAVVGTVFAVIPGALIIGWILLPIAFVLAIVALFQKGRKLFGVLALALSIVGTIAGVIVFVGGLANAVSDAVDDSVSGGDLASVEPAEPAAEEAPEEEAPEEEAEEDPAGTRSHPHPLGTTVSNDEWSVTINSVQLDATEAVLAANVINAAPAEGEQYILVNVTATYTGAETGMPAVDLSFAYVTADGVTVHSYDTVAVAPDAFDSMAELYTDASITGNIALAAPSDTAGEGTIVVTPGIFGDDVFFAAK